MKTCFICYSQCYFYLIPQEEITSTTGKSVYDIFHQITNLNPTNYEYICHSCMIKCNEFDEFSFKAEEISRLFLDYFKRSKKSKVNKIKEKIDDSDSDVCIIEDEPLIHENIVKEEKAIVKEPLIEEIPERKIFIKEVRSISNVNQPIKSQSTSKVIKKLPDEKKTFSQPANTKNTSRFIDKFRCDFPNCYFSFPTKFRLLVHQNAHKRQGIFKCDECGAILESQEILNDHKRFHQGDTKLVEKVGVKTRGNPQYKNSIHTCDHCGRDIKRLYFVEHFYRFHSLTRPHLCSSCGKAFSTKTALNTHQAVHANEENKNYVCDICGLRFFNRCRLKSHITNTHAKLEKTHECQYCGKKFSKKFRMKTHARIVHLHKMKGYIPTAIDVVCNLCGKLFDQKRSLIKHMDRVHNSTPLN